MLLEPDGFIQRIIEEKCCKHQYDEAEFWAEFLCAHDKESEPAKFSLGYVYLLQSKFGAAIKVFQDCVSIRARYFLAKCYIATGKYQEAIETLLYLKSPGGLEDQRVTGSLFYIEIKPSDISKLYSQIYYATGQRQMATQHGRAAYASDPSLVHCLRQSFSGEYDQMPLNDFEELIERLLEVSNGTGGDQTHVSKTDSKSSQASRKKKKVGLSGIPLHSSGPISHDLSAHLLQAVSDIQQIGKSSRGLFQSTAKSITGNQLYSAAAQAYLLYELKDYEGARSAYRKVLDCNPFYEHFMEHYPSVLWHLRDTGSLAELGVSWKEDIGTLYLSWIAFGNLFSLQGDRDSAVKSFNKAAALRPLSTQPHLLCGYEFLSIEDYQAAEEYFALALKHDPVCGKALLGLGIVYYRRNELEKSEAHLTAASTTRPDDAVVWTYLASVYSRFNRPLQAMQAIMKALLLCPKDTKALYLKANLSSQQGKLEEALETLETLKTLAPTEPAVFIEIAQVLFRLKKPAMALKALTAASDLDPQNSLVLELLEKYQT